MAKIVDHIGMPALLEQTAEECCELAQACLKMARKLRDENPTPKSIEDIRDNLVEEMADVKLCFDQVMFTTKIIDETELLIRYFEKQDRWQKRLEAHIDLEEL